MRPPQGFRHHSGKRFTGWIREGFSPPELLLEYPDKIGTLPGAEHLLDCEGRQIHRLPLGWQGGEHSCFTYYFTNGSLGRSFRRSYAFRSLQMSLRLQRHGFSTPDILAACKRRGERLNWTGLLVAAEIQSVWELPSAGRHVFQIHHAIDLSDELAAALGRYLASLHGVGFFHGDLKSRHILVSRQPESPSFHLVDLEKSLYLPRVPASLKVILASRDLVQLFASLPGATDHESKARLILESYLQSTTLNNQHKKRLKKLTSLYGKQGSFRQGRTLLENLIGLLRRD